MRMIRIFWRKSWKRWQNCGSRVISSGTYSIRVSLFPWWRDDKVVTCLGELNYNINNCGRVGFFEIVHSSLEFCDLLQYSGMLHSGTLQNGFLWRHVLDKVRWDPEREEYFGWFGVRILFWWLRISPFVMRDSGTLRYIQEVRH